MNLEEPSLHQQILSMGQQQASIPPYIPQSNENDITQSLPVPEYKMGWIVGKRGSYINQLSKKSGAQITISESTSKEYGTVWKYVQITGTGRAVDRAKKLLHIRLERLEPRSGASPRATEEETEPPMGFSSEGPSSGGYRDQLEVGEDGQGDGKGIKQEEEEEEEKEEESHYKGYGLSDGRSASSADAYNTAQPPQSYATAPRTHHQQRDRGDRDGGSFHLYSP